LGHPEVFARLLIDDRVLLIDVGRVVGARAAVDVILGPVCGEDKVVAGVTRLAVRTEIAVYAVVSESAIHRVVGMAAGELIIAVLTTDIVGAIEAVDLVCLLRASGRC